MFKLLVLTKDEEDRAKSVHDRSLVIDGHSDIMLDVNERRSYGAESVLNRIHIPKMREGGVNAAIISISADVYTWDSTENVLESLGNIYSELEENPGSFVIATTAADIKKAVTNNTVFFILNMEGGRPIKQDMGLLRVFYKLGVRSMGLSWNWRNFIADGVMEPANSGLSLWGMDVIEEMNRLGMIIDVAHVAKGSVLDVLEISKDPVIVSHTCSRSLCDHPRNLDDETVERISENGGVIGLAFVPSFIDKKKPTLNRLVDHIDYITELVGFDHVGLGPDYINYLSEKKHAQLVKQLPKKRERSIKGLEDVTKTPNITRAMVKRGYSDEEIEKVLGLNFLRIFETGLH